MADALKRKLWILLAVPLVVTVVLLCLAARNHRQELLESEAMTELREQIALLRIAAVAVSPGQDSNTHLRHAIERSRVERAVGERTRGVALFERSGELITASEPVLPLTVPLADLARQAAASRDAVEQAFEVQGTRWFAGAVALSGQGGSDAGPVVVLARDLAYVGALSASLDREIAAGALAVLVLAVLAAALMTRALTRKPAGAHPHLNGAAHAEKGEPRDGAPEMSAEEMSRLARAVNSVNGALGGAHISVEVSSTERIALEHKVRHSQMAAAINHVADAVAHELGSPLNTILGRARLSAGYPNCPEEVRASLEIIAGQCERITRVVAEVLAAARPSRSPLGRCDLAQITEQVLAHLQPEYQRRHVRTHLECAVFPAYVDLDEERAFQILFNLCLSALDAQPNGGEVILRILEEKPREGAPPRIVVEVEDRGRDGLVALPENIVDTLSAERERAGGALSLAITRGLVMEAGGSMDLRPAAEGGTLCHIMFPRKQAPTMVTEVRS